MTLQLVDSSPSSSSTCSHKYDVFLSFRGQDTRHGFTGHLYNTLVQSGFTTFKDDDELRRGELIATALLRAIEESKLSLIVFSESYASSRWCLDELVHIIECKRWKNQMVHPIFYKVNPSDVRHQTGKYGEALARHELRFEDDKDRVLRWRAALKEAADLSGSHFSGLGYEYEYEFIGEVVREISSRVKRGTKLNMPECQVGLDLRLRHMLEILDVEANDVRMVGIWGIGGIGKTTVAKAVYNEIAHKFDGCCFLADVRKGSEQHGGLVKQQNKLLSSIVRLKELKINNLHEGATILRKTLRQKRILLVVDDVSKEEQLKNLVGGTDWFGRGSRIIITTRDKRLLTVHGVNPIYNATELVYDEGFELFCSIAFKTKRDLYDSEKLLVDTVVEYAQGVPLALEVVGSNLSTRPLRRWQDMIDCYKRCQPEGIQGILKVSYDGLEDTVKEVFLDIACFFKGWNTNDVIKILEGCGRINAMESIAILEEKALITAPEFGQISMHDLLEEMGKEAVDNQEKDPRKRSRLWNHTDVLQVLTENSGTSKIEGIIVKMPTEVAAIHLHPKCFKRMENLKIFININGRFVGKVDYYPKQLRVLDWPECPLQYLPSNLDMKKMIHLKMPGSHISHLGEGIKGMQNLTSLNLGECKFLTQIPDVSGSPNLKILDLGYCTSLVDVHPSVGSLEKLVELNLELCSNLVKLPENVHWRSLEYLNLSWCSRLESFPEIVGEMKCMKELILWDAGIKALPSSIRNLINLEELTINKCRNLTGLPCSMYELHKLRKVAVVKCQKLVTFPNNVSHDDHGHSFSGCRPMDNLDCPCDHFSARGCNLSNADFMASLDCASTLSHIDFSGNPFVVLPECIKDFVNLRRLNLSDCRWLVEIPELPPGMVELDVRDCVSLQRISKLSNILERQESQMIKEMDLTNGWRLCQNLVEMANEEYDEAGAHFFCCLLSSQLSEFRIRFPVPRSEVPKWFTCQMDFKGHRGFEFLIETLPNFKWDSTGLALCVSVDNKRLSFELYIYINEILVVSQEAGYVASDNVLVQYIPFHEMWQFDYRRPLPPFTCRLIISESYHLTQPLKSCGVHLVMPPNEDVCMQLICAENFHSNMSWDERHENKNWENYGPKQGECSAPT
ncbi:TMV resistance protein N-like [Argentina anserina]|uniref:TMV resistance protein N-like n=1 Tax=Argentina anserina TaxID=57926 RepID=UPI0021764FA7|nr:TMV resistance protein N-like [Potentilla anserina]XP_050366683.1 TMV resistance protein N-like [Potentilla anserina]XP_050366684.1 TMV resistance protein N-like [Potentilla anserina]XP_050366685.1 TMV resistance protein N-like [Potentilla anserina]XP_050366686.1 TMV resistance protein N-like [Potentilla anserina]XP_050366687.1 TMV resistance protein N-like [Potentilla anserina]